MSIRITAPRGSAIAAALAVAAVIGMAPAGAAFGAAAAPAAVTHSAVQTAVDPGTPSATLASTPWETTGAKDQNGADVALGDKAVSNYVGWAYYKTDGTFTMYNLDDTPKMQGDWTVSADGKTRTLVAKDAAGKVLFTRDVPIMELTDSVFTYRVFPNADDTSVYYDIIHTPTDHAEPAAATAPVDETEKQVEAKDGELATTGGDAPVGLISAAIAAIVAGAGALWYRSRRKAAKA